MSGSSAPALDSPVVGRGAMIAGTTAAVVGTFLLRYLTAQFTDDHFVHLSRAAQMIRGDVPIRDFFDPGALLLYYASIAGLFWSGHNLLGELIVTTGFIAAGAGLTFVAAARLSGSFWIGISAAFIGALSMPRLYNYPKVFFYVLAIAGAWWYAQRPGRGRLIALAAITVTAFLFRHDHGLYIGIATVALIATRHVPDRQQLLVAFRTYVAATLVLLAPYLVFVASTRGLRQYLADLVPQAQSLATVRTGLLPITIDRSEPLLELALPSGPRINVRWTDGIEDEARKALEQRHGLVRPEHVEGSTWSYVLLDIERQSIRTLINDPAVLDTHGLNRAKQELDERVPFYLGLQRRYPLLRLRVAPGVFSRGNARAWFYDVTLLTPVAGLLVLGWLAWQRKIDRTEASVVMMASLVCLIIVQTIVRGAAESRLPDVTNPISVVGAWVIARCLKPQSGSEWLPRLARRASMIAVALVSVWSVGTEANAMAAIETSGILAGPAQVRDRMSTVTERLGTVPLSNWDRNAPGIPAVARYLFECTAPTDHVFVTWFAPQIVFYAERQFAGGQVFLLPGWYSSPADQLLTIERMRQQRVPVVLEEDEPDYQVYFATVYEYVHQYYREATSTSEAISGYRVLVDQRLTPTSTYEPLGLPCFK
jgi:hypothetical protein